MAHQSGLRNAVASGLLGRYFLCYGFPRVKVVLSPNQTWGGRDETTELKGRSDGPSDWNRAQHGQHDPHSYRKGGHLCRLILPEI
jgi:hypothetical protein